MAAYSHEEYRRDLTELAHATGTEVPVNGDGSFDLRRLRNTIQAAIKVAEAHPSTITQCEGQQALHV
jgi:hypothetical protein